MNQPGFLRSTPQKSRLFLFFKKGTGFQYPILCRSPVTQKGGFFRFQEELSVRSKRAPEEMEENVENTKETSFKHSRTRPEYRTHTGPPALAEKPVCTASPLCEGCPFPGHGFLCQGGDGDCMRTRMEKIRAKEENK